MKVSDGMNYAPKGKAQPVVKPSKRKRREKTNAVKLPARSCPSEAKMSLI